MNQEKAHYYVIPLHYEELLAMLQASWLLSSETAYTIITGRYAAFPSGIEGETIYTSVQRQEGGFIAKEMYGIREETNQLYKFNLQYFILEAFPSFLSEITLPLDVLEFESSKKLLEWQNQ